MPSRHSSIVVSWIFPEEKVGVICADDNLVLRLLQEVPPSPEHFTEHPEFFAIYVVVLLGTIHGFGDVRHRA